MEFVIAFMLVMSVVCMVAGAMLRYHELGQVTPVAITPNSTNHT